MISVGGGKHPDNIFDVLLLCLTIPFKTSDNNESDGRVDVTSMSEPFTLFFSFFFFDKCIIEAANFEKKKKKKKVFVYVCFVVQLFVDRFSRFDLSKGLHVRRVLRWVFTYDGL